MKRRTFVVTTAAAAVGGHLKSLLSRDTAPTIGVQLYTVRVQLGRDFERTLGAIAAMGFKEVEFAGYFGRSPQEVRSVLDRHGLRAPAAHVGYQDLESGWSARLDAAHIIGHRYLVVPFVGHTLRTPDGWRRVADAFNVAGELSQKAGIQFAFHNHHFEFLAPDGRVPYDFLLGACDPILVRMEMDIFWIMATGQDPVSYFKRHPGRFPLLHLKDMGSLPQASTTQGEPLPIASLVPYIVDVGAGIVDWKRILSHSEVAGVKYAFVEHDEATSPLESLATSRRYLQSIGF